MTYEEALAVATANNEIDENQTFLIDKNLRTVTIPDKFVLGVFNDKNVQIVPFAMPRFYNGIDMSTFAIQINYVNSNGDGDIYLVFDPDVQEELILFDWIVDRTAFATAGKTGFVVCMKEDDENGYVAREFNTTIAYAPVLEGLEIENPIDEQTALDILTQIQLAAIRADEAADEAETSSNAAATSESNAADSATAAATSESNAAASATAAAASAATASSAETNAVSARDAAIEAAETATEAAAELSTGAAIPNALFNKTAWSDDIVKISDGADGVPIRSLVADITPTQDLHGQSNPYPAGGGKNLLPITFATNTANGITAAMQTDGTVKVTGTATNNTEIIIGEVARDNTKSYAVSGSPSGGSTTTYRQIVRLILNDASLQTVSDTGSGYIIPTTLQPTATWIRVSIWVANGQTVNLVYKPMVEVGNTVTAFAPYTNICPISGRTGLTVTRAGKNLLADTIINGQVGSTGGFTASTNRLTNANAEVSPVLSDTWLKAGKYTLSCSGLKNCTVLSKDASGTIIDNFAASWHDLPYTFTLTKDAYVVFTVRKSDNSDITASDYHPQIEYGSTATAYEPYLGASYPVTWQTQAGTVYGGTLNVTTGVLKVDRVCVTFTENDAWVTAGSVGNGNLRYYVSLPVLPDTTKSGATTMCSCAVYSAGNNGAWSTYNYGTTNNGFFMMKNGDGGAGFTSLDDFKTWVSTHTVQLCYYLATPQVIQLSPTEIKTLKDFNQIYSDIGKLTITYIADTEDAATDVMYKALVTDSASGNIAAFEDGAGNAPLESLVSQITPIQDLNGQSNPYPPGGGKNLLNNTAQTTTENGITWTVNSDGTVTANGTATADAQFRIDISATDLPRETNLYFSGCPSGGSSSKYNLYVWDVDANARAKKWNNITDVDNDTGASANNELYLVSGHSYRVICRVMSGQTVSNLVFKPMIRLATESDGTYAPYTNICPISGRTGMTVTAAGKNLIGTANTVIGEGYNANGEVETNANRFRTTPIKCAGQDYVTLSWTAGSMPTQAIRCIWDENGNLLNRTIPSVTISGDTRYYTTSLASFSGAAYIAFAFYADGGASAMDNTSNVMAEFSSTPTNYEVGNVQIYPITWQTQAGTVYGGTLDVVSGVLTVTRVFVSLYGVQQHWVKSSSYPGSFFIQSNTFSIAYNVPLIKNGTPFICSHARSVSRVADYEQGCCFMDGSLNIRIMDSEATLTDWRNYLDAQVTAGTPVQVCCQLATPQTFSIPPTIIRSLLGGNTIYSDSGDVSVDYRADTKLYINKKIAEALA